MTSTPLNDRILGRIVRQTAPWTRPAPTPDPVETLAARRQLYALQASRDPIIPLAVHGNVVEVRDADTGRTLRLTISAEEEA